MNDLKTFLKFLLKQILGLEMYSSSREILENVNPRVFLPLIFYFGWIILVAGIFGWGILAVLYTFVGVSNPIRIGQRILFAIPITGGILLVSSWLIRNAADAIRELFQEEKEPQQVSIVESILNIVIGILTLSIGLLYRQLGLRQFPPEGIIQTYEGYPLLFEIMYEIVLSFFILVVDSVYIGILLLSCGSLLTGYYQLTSQPEEKQENTLSPDSGKNSHEIIEDLDQFR